MKNLLKTSRPKNVNKGLPDYYISPTHDFTQYTRDCEQKHWNKETMFNWQQSVHNNLKEHLEQLRPNDFSRVAFMTLPMIKQNAERKIEQLLQHSLPPGEDALKDIGECIAFDRTTIQRALSIQSPLKQLQLSPSMLKDQLEILQGELVDLRALQRLGLVRQGAKVKDLENDIEKQQQLAEVAQLTSKINHVKKEHEELKAKNKIAGKQLQAKVRVELDALTMQVVADLQASNELIQQVLQNDHLPDDPHDIARLKDLILKRQVRGLKDIANHALVVEQSAIAPLTMGIIHYKRHREIQEAMTTFINDEAKHSATFRRFLVEKLGAREYISAILIKGANRYMWLARFMPGTGLFMAVIVEAIGAAYLEFFGNEKYMPDDLFCSICKTISEKDETRHMDLCVAMYNELFRKGDKWERFRNNMALKVMMKAVYGDKTEDHHLIQAFRAFGVESKVLYQHIFDRLSNQLARISLYVAPERLQEIIVNK